MLDSLLICFLQIVCQTEWEKSQKYYVKTLSSSKPPCVSLIFPSLMRIYFRNECFLYVVNTCSVTKAGDIVLHQGLNTGKLKGQHGALLLLQLVSCTLVHSTFKCCLHLPAWLCSPEQRMFVPNQRFKLWPEWRKLDRNHSSFYLKVRESP